MSESMRVSRCDTQTCEECGGQLLDDGTETVCDDCGLVADEDAIFRGAEWARAGTGVQWEAKRFQPDVADVAGVSGRTVRRHWQRLQEAGIDGGQVDV